MVIEIVVLFDSSHTIICITVTGDLLLLFVSFAVELKCASVACLVDSIVDFHFVFFVESSSFHLDLELFPWPSRSKWALP